jgi:serine/threonine protein kinase/tetratricopeptide (TPR) repeat protein
MGRDDADAVREEGSRRPTAEHDARTADLLSRLERALGDRYRVEAALGEGAMAVVFRAEDRKHHRRVAIKVLKPELARSLGAERFLREIEIAAQLTHPNILPLHDSGEAEGLLYYVMPYVEGESLRHRLERERQLSLEDAIRITREVASAISHAHGQGLIHRDIKPENILLSGGQAVVSDFGIARAVGAAGGNRMTDTGLAVGTPAYMSPEQAAGEWDVDARTDVYSLGCVLYEMLAGAPPYTAATPQALLARKAVERPPRLSVVRDTISAPMEAVVEKALARAPADRFATAAQFSEALARAAVAPHIPTAHVRQRTRRKAGIVVLLLVVLAGTGWWISSAFGGPGGIQSLAVLPLGNLSGNPEQQFFVAGMHDALIGELSQISALRVISRTSTLKYEGTTKSIPEIARELGVDAIVEGSVQRAGDSVRIQVQLIEARPAERHVWANAYGRDVRSVLALHGDVARAIAREIRVRLTPQEQTRLTSTRWVNPEAYEAYLRGSYLVNTLTRDGMESGLRYLQLAVEKDPDEPLAHAGLAVGYSLVGSHGASPPPDAFARAKESWLRALELDETVAEVHAALAEIKLYSDWDWPGAERSFLRALELNPNLAPAHAHYAWYLNLFGRQDEALAEMKLAQQADPLTALWTAWLGDLHWSVGEHDRAIEELKRSLEIDPNLAWAFYTLGFAYTMKGMYDEAIAANERAVAVNPEWGWVRAYANAAAGRSADARRLAADLEKRPVPDALNLSLIYATLGEKESAFRWLDAAYQARHPFVPWYVVHLLDPLRDDPRYRDMVKKLKLN